MFKRGVFLEILILMFCVLSLISCNKDINYLKTELNQLSAPTDEATPQEREAIQSNLALISQKAAQFGYVNDFKSIPIVVTVEDNSATHRDGSCMSDHQGKGLYITIHRQVLKRDRFSSSWMREVFSVLLHEIGHCYLGRAHESTLLSKKNELLQAELTDKFGSIQIVEEGFPVSVMTVLRPDNCAGTCIEASSKIPSIAAMQDYYVAELFGVRRITSAAELSEFPILHWIAK